LSIQLRAVLGKVARMAGFFFTIGKYVDFLLDILPKMSLIVYIAKQ